MKVTTIPVVLAAIAATVTSTKLGSNITDMHLKVTLAADAIDTLKSNGLWAPDPDAFSRGQPNVENVNITAENLKYEASDLNIDDLVSVTVDDQAITTVGVDKAVTNTDVCSPYAGNSLLDPTLITLADSRNARYPDCCQQCHTCTSPFL